MNATKVIQIADLISKDLALRYNANVLFNIIESYSENHIKIDFSGVLSITWSFAHEYLSRKQKCTKTISEINVPVVVRKMFEVVKAHSMKKLSLPS